MISKNRKPQPSKWDSKAKRTAKRVTQQVKYRILNEYEDEKFKGKDREATLEKLGRKYGRATRTIERYISDAKNYMGLRPELKEEVEIPNKGKSAEAKLEFEEPDYSLEGALGTLSGKAELWRLKLRNTQPNTVARNVRVFIVSTDPPTHIQQFDLHEMHVNKPPYHKSRDIRDNDPPIKFDVIGRRLNCKESEPKFYTLRGYGCMDENYTTPMSDDEVVHLRDKGLLFIIQAIPDPPAEGTEKKYRAFIDANGAFILKEGEEPKGSEREEK